MSLALSTLLYEWRRYMAAVMALALSGLLVLAMTGVFIGIGKGFTATIERSGADIMIMQPGATSLIGGPSGVPRRFIPLAYRHPEVVEVKPLDGAGGSFQSIKTYDPTMSQAERAKMKAPRREFVQTVIIDTAPGSVTIPRDYSQELVDALRQPYTVAVDETALTKLGVQLGDRALYNGRTVTVVGVTRGYPNMMQSTIVMSRDTLRMVGQSDEGPRVGPLMIKISDPARAQVVAAQLTAMGDGQWKAWTRQELADANAGAMFEEGILVIIIGGCVVLGTIIGVAITWQTLRGAIMANIKEFASLRALGVGMGSLRRIVMELSFWVGLVGVGAAIFLTWLVQQLALANAVIIALPPGLLIFVGGGLIVIAMLSGLLSMGVLKNSQPADLLR
ncbi:ABC transporter permease [Brevundimonas sp.]|uniref:ABC transporter permease n=1 Tax=Brevundimonas sp. TaxID=1871086 RepID=UPI00351906C9